MPMRIESIEPTLRKHHRSSSSGDDSESGCKRRKHRHRHHNHRCHGHRTDKEREGETIFTKELEAEKFDGIEVEDRNLEKNGDDDGGSFGEVPVSGGSVFQEADSDMEEGEIVEDDNPVDLVTKDLETSEKDLHSDVESGEIGTKRSYSSKMGVNGVDADGFLRQLRILGNGSVDSKQSSGVDQHMIFYSNGLVNGHCLRKSDKIDNDLLYGVCKKTGEFVGGVEQQSRMHSPSLEKRPRAVSPYHFHDKYVKESSSSSLSKSPEWARGRSRSQSIVRETSVEDYCFVDGKHQSEFDGVSSGVHLKIFPNSSEVGVTVKERKRDSRRYMDGRERHHNRNRDAYREGSEVPGMGRHRYRYEEKEWTMERERNRNRGRDSWDRDWARYIEKECDKDSYRERERRRHREREQEKERDSVKDRVREERSKEMDRGREFRNNGRDKYMLNGRDLLSRHTKFDRDRDFVSPYRKNSEDYNKERPSRSDLEKITSKHREELDTNNIEREGNSQEEYQEEVVVQLEDQEEDDLEKIKEESRRLRQAILEKHKCQQLQSGAESQDMDEDKVGKFYAHGEVMKEKHDSHLEGKDVYASELSISGAKSALQNGLADIPMSTGTGGLGEGTPMSERSDDIFGESPAEVHKQSERSDDIFCDDIFGESPADVRKPCKDDGLAIGKNGLNDNWDDAEGYYGHRLGEVLDGRYEIIAAQGKGVFSTVVRAKDLKAKPGDHDELAIKIIRNNETMYKAGMNELVILKKLLGADPGDRRHCVRFLSTFKYRNHLCLVFESLHMNLREVLKKFGRNIGLKLTAVRTYAKQLFIALKHLKNCGVLHCDIKPDNMLVNEAKNVLKLCDFGSAMFSGKNEITPYLVSRFYRAPEIILGLPYDHPLDIWSVGCCLFELYTGKVLFPGATNNDMLRLHMELKGPFSKKMLRKGAFTNQHFDPDLNFIATEEDLVSKKAMRRMIVNAKPKDFGTLLSASPGEDPKMVANFKDLMEKIFILDPDKRLTVSQALNHPFLTGK